MGRTFYFLRHAERCDPIRNTYSNKGEGFLKLAFDEDGNYSPHDINMPYSVYPRSDGWRAYGYDPPLTEVGAFSANLTGKSFDRKDLQIDFVYSSPALRCVQTAKYFIEGSGMKSVEIRVEPGLYEWLEWFKKDIPTWIHPKELKIFGFPVNDTYFSAVQIKDLLPGETLPQFYKRSDFVMKTLEKRHTEGNIFIVAHVGNMSACTRSLLNEAQPSREDFRTNMSSFEYLYFEGIEDDGVGNFRSLGRPAPPLTISAVTSKMPKD